MADIALVLGASGQLGSEIKEVCSEYDELTFYFANKQEIDIANPDLLSLLEYHRPSIIINCAAYTAVDKAEEEAEKSRLINAFAVKSLAKAVDKIGATLIHISSDYTYHIHKRGPLKEDDDSKPKGVYAKTKLEGETYIKKYCQRHIIIRTSWLYSSFGNNFVKTMLKLAKNRNNLSIVDDQWGAPTYARDLAYVICTIASRISGDQDFHQFGLYNYANEGITSWADFAKAIFNLTKNQVTVTTTTTKAYGAPSPRPRWSMMSTKKIKSVFGIENAHWHEALRRMLKKVL